MSIIIILESNTKSDKQCISRTKSLNMVTKNQIEVTNAWNKVKIKSMEIKFSVR